MTAGDQECWPLIGAFALAVAVVPVLAAQNLVDERTLQVASAVVLALAVLLVILYKAVIILSWVRQVLGHPAGGPRPQHNVHGRQEDDSTQLLSDRHAQGDDT